MKGIKQEGAIAVSKLVFAACQNLDQNKKRTEKEGTEVKRATSSRRDVDPKKGTPFDLYYNAQEKMTYNRETDKPVKFYVNTNTGDTVYGGGRYIVNGFVIRGDDGIYRLDDSKVMIDGDELKIIGENGKLKIEGDEMK